MRDIVGVDPTGTGRAVAEREESAFSAGCRRVGFRLGAAQRPVPVFGRPPDNAASSRPAERSIVIAGQGRSGSTLLALALSGDRLAGWPDEYVSIRALMSGWRVFGQPVPTYRSRAKALPKRILLKPGWWRHPNIVPGSFDSYWDEVVRRRTTSYGVFGTKMLWDQYETANRRWGFSFEMLPGSLDWIYLRRRDRVAQAASFVKARQTRQFTRSSASRQRFLGDTHYDDDAMILHLTRVQNAEAAWDQHFAACGIDPIEIWYEDLDDDADAVIRDLVIRLGLDVGALQPPDLVRTRDATNEQWIARFCDLHPDLAGPNRDGRPDGTGRGCA
jgi:trehalose 2-sulfotransferase